MKRRARPGLWIAAGLISCPLLLCGVGFGLFRSWFGAAAGRLAQERELAKRAGLPLGPQDLRRIPPLARSENAAPDYARLFSQLRLTAKESADVTAVLQGTAKPEASQRARSLVAGREGPLSELARATAKPHCDFEKDYAQGAALMYPEFSDARGALKQLLLRARMRAAGGKTLEALSDLEAGARLSQHIGEEPVVIAYLVQIAMESLIHNSLEDILQASPRDAKVISRAREVAENFGPLPDLRASLRGEIVLGQVEIPRIKTLKDISAISGGDLSEESSPGLNIRIPASARDAFLARHLKLYREMYARFPKENDWEAIGRVMKEVDREVEADKSLANTMNRILAPVFQQAADAAGRLQAQRNVTITSIRVLEIRAAKGSLPDTLPDLPTSIDPFTGSRLRYRREGSGFAVYSVDRDGNDDGGIKRTGNQPGDLVRRYK